MADVERISFPAGKALHCLCLNAAEGLLQFGLASLKRTESGAEDLIPLCSQVWRASSQGAELLTPALADALERLGLAPGDIGRIACVRGPGSFTGLRLVLATAAGLARATGAKQGGIDYLPLLAYNACRRLGGFPAWKEERPETEGASPIWVLTHARKDLVHVQGFRLPLSKAFPRAFFAPVPFTDILVCPPREAALHILAHQEKELNSSSARPGRPLLLGSGLSRHYATMASALAGETPGNSPTDRALLLSADFDHPLPESLLEYAGSIGYADGDIEPLYVRPADAEDNLERIALSMGLDPDRARARLAALRKR